MAFALTKLFVSCVVALFGLFKGKSSGKEDSCCGGLFRGWLYPCLRELLFKVAEGYMLAMLYITFTSWFGGSPTDVSFKEAFLGCKGPQDSYDKKT